MRNKNLAVREVFTRIYDNSEWGGKPGDYCSGTRSSHASLYGDMVKSFIRENRVLSVVDLGCGDFVAGRKLLVDGVKYIGVDIVDSLIRRNQREYGSENVSFHCLDIISDPLPDGELCLIRQVLQHLSNSQIKAVLRKIGKYNYVMITEHYPGSSVSVVPNKDKPHGADTRICDKSAVYLDLPPFNMRISRVMLEVEAGLNLAARGEVIRTFLIGDQSSPASDRSRPVSPD